MDPGVAIGVGVLWLLFNLFGRKRKSLDPKDRPTARPGVHPPVRLPSTGSDPTQMEGARLQDLLRELGKTLDTAAGQRGRPVPGRLPAPKRVEPPRSLEATTEARSLEEDVQRPTRAVVDADDEAEAIVARRIAAAEANARPLEAADHLAFDARIRQEPADATGTKGYSMRRLRDAVVWSEILGPPVSLRDTQDP